MYSVLSEPMATTGYQVKRVQKETSDTFTFELLRPDGQPAGAFLPGQFNMLYVFGVGEAAISISGDPAKPESVRHTTRAVGTVTRAMAKLRPGQMLGVRGPYGTGWPLDEAEGSDVVIVAGGIGLAPLRPLIYSILRRRDRYGKFVLLYGTRTPEDVLYTKELEQWRGRFDMDVLITVDRATGSWRGHVGVVTDLIARAGFDPYHALAYVCGPEIMMLRTLEVLEKRGVARDRAYCSIERNMKCAIGLCGHCQYGPLFICKDGPVFRYDRVARLLALREI